MTAGFVLLSLLLQAAPSRVDQAPAPDDAKPRAEHVRVDVVGGFLGQIEGFCEFPSGPFQLASGAVEAADPADLPCRGAREWPKWLGGALGASAWREALSRTRTNADWLILAPNNESFADNASRDAFWSIVNQWHADVVALGQEDFLRRLRTTDGAAPLVQFLGRARTHRMLGSNIAIRSYDDDVSRLEGGAFRLHLPQAQSISWLQDIVVDLPCDQANVPFELWESAAKPSLQATTGVNIAETTFKEPLTAPCHGRVDRQVVLKAGTLRPDRWYVLDIGGTRLWFSTDRALWAPSSGIPSENAPPVWAEGLPVVARASDAFVAVSLVDPAVKSRLGESAWTYPRGSDCVADRCEVIFMDPQKTIAAILDRARAVEHRTPALIAISSLSDEGTVRLVGSTPEIRLTILSPDSDILGRQAPQHRSTKNDLAHFSGDMGQKGVIDGTVPEVAKVFVRPEWFGETGATVDVNLASSSVCPDPYSSECHRPVPTMNVNRVDINTIVGAALRADVGHGTVAYFAHLGQASVPLGSFTQYAVCGPQLQAACTDWSDGGPLLGAILEGFRRGARSEIALLPKSAFDDDYLQWVSLTVLPHRQDWLSRYVLERVLYQSPRLVRAYVPGSALVGTLSKLSEDSSEPDGYCMAGVGRGCGDVDKAHPDRLLVNSRRVQPELVYSIAMPDALAEKLDLDHDDSDPLVDAQQVVDHYFSLVSSHLSWSGYANFTTLQAGLSQLRFDDDREGLRKVLDIPSAGAEANRTSSYAVVGDVAILDTHWFAVRAPFSLEYSKRTTLQVPDSTTSYPKDKIVYGGRGDLKLRLLREVRIFGGYLVDGASRTRTFSFTPTRSTVSARDDLTLTEAAKIDTSYDLRPSRFYHGVVGAESLSTFDRKLGSVGYRLKTAGWNFGWGHATNVFHGAQIDGIDQTSNDLLSKGAKKLVNEVFADHPSDGTVTFVPIQNTFVRRRHEVNLDGEASMKLGTKTWKLNVTYQLQYYVGRLESDFSVKRTADVSVKLAMPLWHSLALQPSYERQTAFIQAGATNRFVTNTFEMSISAPFIVKWGLGNFLR